MIPAGDREYLPAKETVFRIAHSMEWCCDVVPFVPLEGTSVGYETISLNKITFSSNSEWIVQRRVSLLLAT